MEFISLIPRATTYPKEFLEAYRGTLLILLQNHRQFQIVTDRTLHDFHGSSLVLPGVRIVSDDESKMIGHYAAARGHVVLSGATDSKLSEVANAVRLPDNLAEKYLAQEEKDYNSTDLPDASELLKVIDTANGSNSVRVSGSKNLVVHAAKIDNTPYLFVANFEGIKAGERLTPTSQEKVRIDVPASYGASMHLLPFLGTETTLRGQPTSTGITFVVPTVERGLIAWFK